MSVRPWKVIESSYLHPRYRMDRCELPKGGLIDAAVFEFHPWASILAMTREREVVLIRQYRHGVQNVPWEFPGGVVEDGEEPLEGARRELLEETGYASSHVIQIGKFYPNPAIQTDTMYCFLALDAERTGGQNLDEAQEIKVHHVSLDEVIEMKRRGEFCHALQAAALFHALIHLECIR